MKAISVLEAILRKADDEHFSVIASYFSDNKDVVVKCSESPQASLREKANKVIFHNLHFANESPHHEEKAKKKKTLMVKREGKKLSGKKKEVERVGEEHCWDFFAFTTRYQFFFSLKN